MKALPKRIIGILMLVVFLSSCKNGELLNSEADILEVILPEGLNVGVPIITNTEVRIPKTALKPNDIKELDEQLRSLALSFILTDGAIIDDDGLPRDFSEPQKYTVVSEDRKWSKEYTIFFYTGSFNETEFHFTYYELSTGSKTYHKFYEVDEQTNSKQYIWDSGNGGFGITALKSTPPEDYPTFSVPYGKVGNGVRLVTRSTGDLGNQLRKPIAAGNLFLGHFDIQSATTNSLGATQFGIPTTMDEPKFLTLWCKYKAGPEYKDKAGNIIDRIDRCEAYAVLYEPYLDENGNPIKLDGHNIRTADNIVSIAVMSEEQVDQIRVNDIVNEEYRLVKIPFEQRKPFDVEKQEEGKYYIAVVFSSSANGNLFEGAIGSTLCVDEVKFIN